MELLQAWNKTNYINNTNVNFEFSNEEEQILVGKIAEKAELIELFRQDIYIGHLWFYGPTGYAN